MDIVDTLTKLGFPTEVEEGDIVVEVTPDRPDIFMYEGVVRVVREYHGAEPKKYVFRSKRGVVNRGVKQRPYIAAALVEGVDVGERDLVYLMNAQEKLHETIGRKRKKVAIGIHDANDISLPIEYVESEDVQFVPLGYEKRMSA